MPVNLIYTIEGDTQGEKSTTSLSLFDGNLLDSLQKFAVAFATILNSAIMGKILDAFLVFDVDISGLTGNTLSDASDVEEVAAFEFGTAENNRIKLNIPGLQEAKVIADTHELDTADTDVAAIIAMMEDGLAVTGGTIEPCDIGEDDIVDTFFAREQFRNSGSRRKA
ncbi:MAG TPA: hypothetical protein V6C65_08945 [Allocoleopsis sp.]